MFCPNCGTRLQEDCVFCTNCGVRVKETEETAPVGEPLPEQEREFPITERITLFPDGKYRWVRQTDLLGNASQLPFFLRCFGIACFVASLIICWGAELAAFGVWACLKFVLMLTGGGLLVAWIVYCLGAVSIGHKFSILYEMDQTQILMSRRLTKSQDFRWLTAGYMMGLMAKPGMSMNYMNLMSDHSHAIQMGTIKSIRWEPKRQAEKLGGSFGLYRVYVDSRDTEQFTAYLKRHCPKLKKCR